MGIYFGNMRRMITDGMKWGIVGGLGLSAIAIALFAISFGAALDHSVKLLGTVILVYLVTGAVAGSVVSLLRPLCKWAIGAAIVGACATVPAYGGMMLAVEGPTHVTWDELQGFLVLGGAIGAIVGVLLRHRLIKRGVYNPAD